MPDNSRPENEANVHDMLAGAAQLKKVKAQVSKQVDKEVSRQVNQAVEDAIKRADIASQIQAKVEALGTEVREFAKDIAKDSYNDLRKELNGDRLNVIQGVAIITLFIGFIGLEFGILKSASTLKQASGLSLMLLSAILIFALLLDILSRDLPLTKSTTTKGGLLVGTDMRKVLYEEPKVVQVPLSFKPRSWGFGLQLRAIMLILALVLMVSGTLLLVIR